MTPAAELSDADLLALVSRGRAGDQNALALIAETRRAAERGSERAKRSLARILVLTDAHPARDRRFTAIQGDRFGRDEGEELTDPVGPELRTAGVPPGPRVWVDWAKPSWGPDYGPVRVPNPPDPFHPWQRRNLHDWSTTERGPREYRRSPFGAEVVAVVVAISRAPLGQLEARLARCPPRSALYATVLAGERLSRSGRLSPGLVDALAARSPGGPEAFWAAFRSKRGNPAARALRYAVDLHHVRRGRAPIARLSPAAAWELGEDLDCRVGRRAA